MIPLRKVGGRGISDNTRRHKGSARDLHGVDHP